MLSIPSYDPEKEEIEALEIQDISEIGDLFS